MKRFDAEEAIRTAAKVPWYDFLKPSPFRPFKDQTSLQTANWHAHAYSKEVRSLQIGRAFWAWTSILLAIIAAIGWLR